MDETERLRQTDHGQRIKLERHLRMMGISPTQLRSAKNLEVFRRALPQEQPAPAPVRPVAPQVQVTESKLVPVPIPPIVRPSIPIVVPNAGSSLAFNNPVGALGVPFTEAGVLVDGSSTGAYKLVAKNSDMLEVELVTGSAALFLRLKPAGTGTFYLVCTDGVWSYTTVAGGGLTDAPSDGNKYARKDGGWITFIEGFGDTGVDGKTYGRRDMGWVDITDQLVTAAEIGTVTTLAYTEDATVELDFTGGTFTFDFGIPAGPPGVTVAQIGSVSTIDPGGVSSANVLLVGSTLTFDFGIVRGDPGEDGEDGHTPTEGELVTIITPIIETYLDDYAFNPTSVDPLDGTATLSDVIAAFNELLAALKH